MMKKNSFAAILLLAAYAYSCTPKEADFQDVPASSLSDLVLVDDGTIVYEPVVIVPDFILNDEEENLDTKTLLSIDNAGVHFTFEDDDKIGIFPYTPEAGAQVRFLLKSSDAGTCIFNCPGFSLLSGQGYAAYYPYNSANSSHTSVSLDYTNQRQTSATTPAASTSANFSISSADYLVAKATPSSGVCHFNMSHVGALVVMDVTVPAGTYKEVSLNTSSNLFTQSGTVDLSQSYTTGPNAGITISSPVKSNKVALALGSGGSGTYLAAGTYRFCMMVAPVDLSGQTVTLRLKDTSNEEHIAYISGDNLLQGYAYRYTCAVDTQTDFYTIHSSQTANSYIVNTDSIDPDGYNFPTFQAGNGHAVDWSSIGFTDGESEAYPTGGGVSLSGNGVVVSLNQNSCVSDVFFANNKIYFKATGNKGNAKLTLTNNGEKVWTWHIWCTSQPGTISGIGNGTNKYTVMDRNLGAYDETKYYSEAGCGLYYPFGHYIGFTVDEYLNGDEGGYRMIDTYALNPQKPYLKYGQNYMTFNSWGATDYQLPWCLLWGGGSKYNYNNYASKIGNTNTKTMYDPCPPGYKVMTYDVLEGYSDDDHGANGGYYGVKIAGTNGDLFLPYNGCIYNNGFLTVSTPWGNQSTRGWKVCLWTSRYWQNLCPTAYCIQLKFVTNNNGTGTKYADDTMNGALYQSGGVDGISIGHGVRCMVGW